MPRSGSRKANRKPRAKKSRKSRVKKSRVRRKPGVKKSRVRRKPGVKKSRKSRVKKPVGFIDKVRKDGDILAEYKHWYAILDLKQYYLGRLFLYAKRAGATDMVELNQDEIDELWDILKFLKYTVYPNTWKPDIINYAFLGNDVQHCHLHVIPRYKSDRQIKINGELFQDENFGHNYSNPNTKATRKRKSATQAKIRSKLKKAFKKRKSIRRKSASY